MSLETDNAGVYALIVEFTESACIEVGALGEHDFEPGHYVYVGSAKQHLRQRIERHFRHEKTTHWHVDYLTTHATCFPRRALMFDADAMTECGLNARVAELVDGTTPVDGFGASDCTEGCRAHLWRTVAHAELERLEPVSTWNADSVEQ